MSAAVICTTLTQQWFCENVETSKGSWNLSISHAESAKRCNTDTLLWLICSVRVADNQNKLERNTTSNHLPRTISLSEELSAEERAALLWSKGL